MMAIVSCHEWVVTPSGLRYLRRVACRCTDYCRRVEISVFHSLVDHDLWGSGACEAAQDH